ncbi:Mss4-like protein [Rhodotorula diobovata]|uniref:Mss4-like protein n=1 Tax=Rhodotorula diobovata TaxID=5288 RepID=A0A5C5G5I7_9BASI|nr:Mss4-like protein [Rhodotorula diobovata]
MSVTGFCNCRAVSVELLDGLASETILCHCTNCRASSGSLFATIMFKPRESVVIHGAEHVKRYADKKTDAGTTLNRNFCGTCGSPVYSFLSETPDNLVIRAGLFEPKTLPPPCVEVFGKRMEVWERAHGDVPVVEGMPTQPAA